MTGALGDESLVLSFRSPSYQNKVEKNLPGYKQETVIYIDMIGNSHRGNTIGPTCAVNRVKRLPSI